MRKLFIFSDMMCKICIPIGDDGNEEQDADKLSRLTFSGNIGASSKILQSVVGVGQTIKSSYLLDRYDFFTLKNFDEFSHHGLNNMYNNQYIYVNDYYGSIKQGGSAVWFPGNVIDHLKTGKGSYYDVPLKLKKRYIQYNSISGDFHY